MRFQSRFRVRFGDTDPAGIVYYPRFFVWFHDLMESMLDEALAAPYAAWIRDRRIGFPAVQIATEFRRPIPFGEEVLAEMFLSRLGPRSMTLEVRIRKKDELAVTGRIKVVPTDLERLRGIPFPDEVLRDLAPYVEADDDGPRSERLEPPSAEPDPSEGRGRLT